MNSICRKFDHWTHTTVAKKKIKGCTSKPWFVGYRIVIVIKCLFNHFRTKFANLAITFPFEKTYLKKWSWWIRGHGRLSLGAQREQRIQRIFNFCFTFQLQYVKHSRLKEHFICEFAENGSRNGLQSWRLHQKRNDRNDNFQTKNGSKGRIE